LKTGFNEIEIFMSVIKIGGMGEWTVEVGKGGRFQGWVGLEYICWNMHAKTACHAVNTSEY